MTPLPLHLPEHTFILPYIYKELGTRMDEIRNDIEIMVSSANIYTTPHENSDENAAVDTGGKWAALENDFIAKTEANNKTAIIIRCGEIIGTGMTGFPARLAKMIWRGTFFHFPNNETRISVIHASDVARTVCKILLSGLPAGIPHTLNLTDAADPTIQELAEALAFRMNEKRISTLSTRPQQWIGKILYGKKLMKELSLTRTADSSLLRTAIGITPVPVCSYLREHVYDETSL